MVTKVLISPRASCISDMVCAVLCPEIFEIDRVDGRASIKLSFRLREDDPSIGVISEDLAYCAEAVAENCPMEIIKVVRE